MGRISRGGRRNRVMNISSLAGIDSIITRDWYITSNFGFNRFEQWNSWPIGMRNMKHLGVLQKIDILLLNLGFLYHGKVGSSFRHDITS